MATTTVIVNNMQLDAVVISKQIMSDLWSKDAEYSDRTYTKGTTEVYAYGKDGCITYSKRPGMIVRKQWVMGICKSVVVCEFTQLPTYQDMTADYPF